MTLDDTTKLEKELPLWIFFDNTYYDYYVGEALNSLPDEEDDDGMPVYYVPCEAFVRADAADDLTTDVADYCVARRHRVEVHIKENVDENEILDIRLINMFNPEPTAAVTFVLVAMNYSHVGAEEAKDEALYYWSTDYTFTPVADPVIDLACATPSGHGLRTSGSIAFKFGVFD